jgi:hypothetical protein
MGPSSKGFAGGVSYAAPVHSNTVQGWLGALGEVSEQQMH